MRLKLRGVKLPQLNGTGFSVTLFKKTASRKIAEIVEEIPNANLRYMIENGINLVDRFPAAVVAEYKADAKKHRWVRDIISIDYVRDMIPEEKMSIVAEYGEQGKEWLDSQLNWISSLFYGE